ncbi:glyoxalase [Mucilaginibacter sp. 14171R-50]|uniref:VOC family protein n=1 Tax=Mucilaginibacter sp. 14171R-50 TaxID=2703789 RepID=UPI00138DA8E4|nr:VOC family protein [Mucilaginibacter sp. 14171R-50]QHS56245.1 glyoxalase [Mucilaginibacter sp. 14171R-50]
MRSIEVISIPVTDQQAAKEFYLKFGFNLMIEAPFQGGANWIQLGLPGGGTSITLVNWFPDLKPGSIQGFVIKCDDLDGTINELAAKGIKVGNADKTPWGRFATVKDPDGNAWSLHGE